MEPIKKPNLDKGTLSVPTNIKEMLRNGEITVYDVLQLLGNTVNGSAEFSGEAIDWLNEAGGALADNEAERISNELERVGAELTRNERYEAAEAERQRLFDEATAAREESAGGALDELESVIDAVLDGENARNAAESQRAKNDAEYKANEIARKVAEDIRVAAEAERKTAETDRIDAEAQRNRDEEERLSKEQEREDSENLRRTAEDTRDINEERRIQNEIEREVSEGFREKEERIRIENEKKRQKVFGDMQADLVTVNNVITNAQEVASHPTKIGSDYYVYVYDTASSAYIRTNIYVKGENFKYEDLTDDEKYEFGQLALSGAMGEINDIKTDITNLTSVIVGKQDKIVDISAIRSGAALGATSVQPHEIADMETKAHASSTYQPKGDYLTEHQDLSGKQDKLVSGTNIKTINGEPILGEGDIIIVGGSGEGGGYVPPSGGIPKKDLSSEVRTSLGKADTAVQPGAIADMETKTDAAATYQPKGDYVTTSDLATMQSAVSAAIASFEERLPS